MHINDIVAAATLQASLSGFTTTGKPRSVAEHVALITTEVGELYEAHRDGLAPAEHKYEFPRRGLGADRRSDSMYGDLDEELGKPVGVPSELADIVIRVANMCGEYGIDLDRAISEKMSYNRTRAYMHGRVH
jgi:NTP pyrophosphatase (non-canonical NTP hydrolase)